MNHRDADEILSLTSSLLNSNKVGKVEEAETGDGVSLYLIDGEIHFFRHEGIIYPTLRSIIVENLPAVIVDMGAIPYICKGADIMAPGIKEMHPNFNEGDLVVIRDIKHRKALAIGKALKSSIQIETSKKGKVIQNLHYVGDKIWQSTAT
jgi:PUA-domain protein